MFKMKMMIIITGDREQNKRCYNTDERGKDKYSCQIELIVDCICSLHTLLSINFGALVYLQFVMHINCLSSIAPWPHFIKLNA